MQRFFKIRKLRSFSDNKFGKYLLYAIGEILLVVIGILVALKINNWNEERKNEKLLVGIFKNMSYDLERDTLLINRAIEFYEAREEVAKKVLADSMQAEDYKSCILCTSMITTYFPVTINDKGYSQLKNYYEDSSNRDSLTVDMVQFYTAFTDILDELGGIVERNTFENLEHWRDTYPWFSNVLSNKPDERFLNYVTDDPDFKNRVAFFYTIACQNYLQILKTYNRNAKEALGRIEERIDEPGP